MNSRQYYFCGWLPPCTQFSTHVDPQTALQHPFVPRNKTQLSWHVECYLIQHAPVKVGGVTSGAGSCSWIGCCT